MVCDMGVPGVRSLLTVSSRRRTLSDCERCGECSELGGVGLGAAQHNG